MKKKPVAGFVKLPYSLLDSEALVAASSHATRLLVLLLRKYNGKNNGSIICGVREAAAWCHCSKGTASKVFIELQTLGIIKAVRRGHFCMKVGAAKGDATVWRILVIPEEALRAAPLQ
jgi:hypothetical protein